MTTRHQGPNHPEVPQIEADAQIGNKEEARSPPNPGVNAVTAAGQFSKKAAIAGWRRPMEQETESDPNEWQLFTHLAFAFGWALMIQAVMLMVFLRLSLWS